MHDSAATRTSAPYENTIDAPLTELTMRAVRDYFDENNHRPSPAQWSALHDLARTMERMADGEAAKKFYLSSLDPGVGKTTMLVKFTGALLSMPQRYGGVGILICVGRLAEIRTLVEEMGVPASSLHVYTSDPETNTLGTCSDPDQAQVLITTQQMVERRLSTMDFERIRELHFHGEPRQVRVWDETWLPGETITLGRYELSTLFEPLSRAFPALVDEIEEFFFALRSKKDGDVVEVPNFMEEHDGETDLNHILGLLSNPLDQSDMQQKERLKSTVSALWFLSGRTCALRSDGGNNKNTVLDYKDTMPIDMAPLLIMDASGRVRQTYEDVRKHRGTLVRLEEAPKNYSNLRVHVWRKGGGKSSFQKKLDQLALGIATTIDSKPDEEWLVVTHQPSAKVGDVEKEVRTSVTTPGAKVHFLPWGQHMATNDYCTVPNVILAGTLFYPTSQYEALKRLGADRSATAGEVTKDERMEVMEGENMHLILQAACRGTVRKSEDDCCGECDLYVIASTRSGIPASMTTIFPGCSVVPWRPIKRKAKGKIGEALAFIQQWFDEEPQQTFLSFGRIQKAIDITRQDFRKRIRNHADWDDGVAELGLVEGPKNPATGRYFTGLRRLA